MLRGRNVQNTILVAFKRVISRDSVGRNRILTRQCDVPMNKRFRAVYAIPLDYRPHGTRSLYKHARYFVVGIF